MTDVSRRAQNRIARETAILDAALIVFSKTGFSGASMEQIAAQSGISKPTLYQYFPNKSDLFKAMMMSKRDEMLQAIDTPDAGEMVPQLVGFAMSYARTVMQPEMLSLARLIIGEAQRFPEIGRSYQAAGPDPLLDGIAAYLSAQRSLGRLTFENAEPAAEDLWGLILSAPRNRALHDPEYQVTPQALTDFVFDGLRVFLKAYATDVNTEVSLLKDIRQSWSIE